MLCSVTISNFAIIDQQEIEFHPGLTVLSGETGAGKSIILGAIEFLLGAKLSPSVIRTGASEVEVQGLFDLSSLPEDLRAELPDIAKGEELSITRSLPREGRGKVYINGRVATVALLEEVVSKLITICGQHQHTRLLSPKYHRALLDGFGGLGEEVEALQQIHREWSEKKAALEAARHAADQSEARREELELVRQELEQSGVRVGLRESLESEIRRLGSRERILELAHAAMTAMNGEGGISDQIRQINHLAVELEKLDSTLIPTGELFRNGAQTLTEWEGEISQYVARLDLDEEALERARDRLSQLAKLERKYKRTDGELEELLRETEGELQSFRSSESLDRREQELEGIRRELQTRAEKVSVNRKKAADQLQKGVVRDLAQVAMSDARFKVDIQEDVLGPSGIDKIQFLIAANAGEPFKPLAEVASGGELSRLTLVLKKAIRDQVGVNVLVFDEVDSGMSGKTARSVGLLLKEIARHSQVICITHLPQVASLADRHLLVDKRSGTRTVSVVRTLTRDEQVDELARMISGATITDAARASARELLASKA